jgi:diketogulonate reductase-like aldo/keto reductase
MKTIPLEDGEIPILGLGTWQLTDQTCVQIVQEAIELGYTHIDTAQIYGNQKEIGKAIADVNREDLWITSKVWRDDLEAKQVMPAVDNILEELDIEYLDLVLIHWPTEEFDMNKTLNALVKAKEAGKVRNVGVSNFTQKHLENVSQYHDDISINQVEYHALLNQEELKEYCEERDIVLTGYSPLAHGKLIGNTVLEDIGKEHDASAAQVAIRWLTQKGVVAIPKASSKDHLKANIDSLEFELTQEEMQEIDSINEHLRTCEPPFADF